MKTFIIFWSILYIGVWVWTIDNFINGNQEWYDDLFPVIMMTLTSLWLVLKKKKK